MPRTNPIAYRLSREERAAFEALATHLGLASPGQLAQKLSRDALANAGFQVNHPVNRAPSISPPSNTLAEQFRSRLQAGGSAAQPPAPHWPYHPRRLEPRQQISQGIAHRQTLRDADAAVTADRRSRDQQATLAPGMMTDAMASRPLRLRR